MRANISIPILLLIAGASTVFGAKSADPFPATTDFPAIFAADILDGFTSVDNDLKNCVSLTINNSSILGDIIVASGRPTFNEPPPALFPWYLRCVELQVKKNAAVADSLGNPSLFFKKYLGSDVSQRIVDRAAAWSFLPTEDRISVIRHNLDRLIGDQVLEEFGVDVPKKAQTILVKAEKIGSGIPVNVETMLIRILSLIYLDETFIYE